MKIHRENKNLPKELAYNCIFSVSAEIKFNKIKDNLSDELLIARLYNGLNQSGKGYEQPEKKPLYKTLVNSLSSYIMNNHNNFLIEYKSNTITLKQINFSYTTWEIFNKEFLDVYKILSPLIEDNIILQLRYINAFDTSKFSSKLLDLINLDININSESINDDKFSFQFETVEEDCTLNVTISNTGMYKKMIDNNISDITASIIDIVTQKTDLSHEEDMVLTALEESHQIIKNMFFGLLKDNLKNTLEERK